MSYEEMNEARNLINDLYRTLEKLAERDPDQEVWEYSYGVIDGVLKLAAAYFEGHPVISQVRELFSPERIAEGSSVRAADLLPTVGVLRTLLNSRVSDMAERMRRDDEAW